MAPQETPASANAPPLLDLTIDNITPNAIRINSQSSDARLTYLMARLVTHLHDFARETRLSTDEWMAGIGFLIACGHISNDVRNVWPPPPPPPLSPSPQYLTARRGTAGIHPPLRRPRPLAPRRQHQPPQASARHRGLRARALPHARRAGAAERQLHDDGPGGGADAGRVHGPRHAGAAGGRRQGGHLGDGQLGALRRAARGARGRERAVHHDERRGRAVLVPGPQARQLCYPARRAGGQVAREAEPASVAAGACALYV